MLVSAAWLVTHLSSEILVIYGMLIATSTQIATVTSSQRRREFQVCYFEVYFQTEKLNLSQ